MKTNSPFKNLCVTIGNLPASYVDSLSYYECLCWLFNYLNNTVITDIMEVLQKLELIKYEYRQDDTKTHIIIMKVNNVIK